MASTGRSMLLSLLLFAVTLSLLEMYRAKFASSELMTIAGGFVCSLLFLLLLTFIGNYQEASGDRTGWGAVVVAQLVALIVAGTVHRVCITTCFLFSAGLLYEVDKLSGMILARSESKVRRHWAQKQHRRDDSCTMTYFVCQTEVLVRAHHRSWTHQAFFC